MKTDSVDDIVSAVLLLWMRASAAEKVSPVLRVLTEIVLSTIIGPYRLKRAILLHVVVKKRIGECS